MSVDFGQLARELDLSLDQIQRTIELLDDGNTVPFVTRYRKDQTGGLDEEQIRRIQESVGKLRMLAERKATILKSIESQGKLTVELAAQINQANSTKRLEDLYLPFKPKKQTLATQARERGLEPLAEEVLSGDPVAIDLAARAEFFVNPDRKLHGLADVLQGVGHLLAERFSERADLRGRLRKILWRTGKLVSTATASKADEQQAGAETIPAQQVLAKDSTQEAASQQLLAQDAPAQGQAQVEAAGSEPVASQEESAETQKQPPSAGDMSADASAAAAAGAKAAEESASETAQQPPAEAARETPAAAESATAHSAAGEAGHIDVAESPSSETTSSEVAASEIGSSETSSAEPASAESASAQATGAETTSAEGASAEAAETAQPSAAQQATTEQATAETEPQDAKAGAAASPKAVEPAGTKAAAAREKKKKKKTKKDKVEHAFKDYFAFEESLTNLPPHRILALNRGERAKALKVRIEADWDEINKTADELLVPPDHPHAELMRTCVRDALNRLVLPSLEREIRRELTERAEQHAVDVFARNLRNLLLQPPVRGRRVLAVDPGFRSGCKLTALDEFGNVLGQGVLHIVGKEERRTRGRKTLVDLINKHGISVVAIGNGTACRETEQLVASVLAEELQGRDVAYVFVNEAGASVYSTSDLGREELPGCDAVQRSAVSIGRRLLDPLSELVKINPANIGVGMYQHDVKAAHLRNSLDAVVESCVNYVGVDVNTASPALLRYVSGLNQLTARRLYEHRREHGPFRNREQFKDVPGFGSAAFVQAAGFLKINGGDNPLDATWIHPESYDVARRVLEKLDCSLEALAAVTKVKAPAASPPASPAPKTAPATQTAAAQTTAGEAAAIQTVAARTITAQTTPPEEAAQIAPVETETVAAPAETQPAEAQRYGHAEAGPSIPTEASTAAAPPPPAATQSGAGEAAAGEATTAEPSAGAAEKASASADTVPWSSISAARVASNGQASAPPAVASQAIVAPAAQAIATQPAAAQVVPAQAAATQVAVEEPAVPQSPCPPSPAAAARQAALALLAQSAAQVDVQQLAGELGVGRLMLKDMLASLTRPGRDPRDDLPQPLFRRGVAKLEDLQAGMELAATVLNVVDFGAFVDIGLSDSGLVHISRLADRFVRDPHEVVAVGDVLRVWVVEVDKDRRRVSLTAIEPGKERPRREKQQRPPRSKERGKAGRRPERKQRESQGAGKRSEGKRSQPPKRQHATPPPKRKARPAKPITKAMEEGREPMRSFSDLMQFFEKNQTDDDKKGKS